MRSECGGILISNSYLTKPKKKGFFCILPTRHNIFGEMSDYCVSSTYKRTAETLVVFNADTVS